MRRSGLPITTQQKPKVFLYKDTNAKRLSQDATANDTSSEFLSTFQSSFKNSDNSRNNSNNSWNNTNFLSGFNSSVKSYSRYTTGNQISSTNKQQIDSDKKLYTQEWNRSLPQSRFNSN